MNKNSFPSSSRSGATSNGASQSTSSATQKPQLERLLKRKAKPLPPAVFLKVAEWVFEERENLGLTQPGFAMKYGIPERQVATYEAVAQWPQEAKDIVRQHPEHFPTRQLVRLFANRSWKVNQKTKKKEKSSASLISALLRHTQGKPPRTRRRASKSIQDPNLMMVQDQLRDKLQTRVAITGDGLSGELRISYFSPGDFERILGFLKL